MKKYTAQWPIPAGMALFPQILFSTNCLQNIAQIPQSKTRQVLLTALLHFYFFYSLWGKVPI
jgi:hypothetical protein